MEPITPTEVFVIFRPPTWGISPLPAPPVNPFRVFYGLTGITFIAFASGFSVCLFDLSKVPECVDYAEKMTGVLQNAGQHILTWFIAIVTEVARRDGMHF